MTAICLLLCSLGSNAYMDYFERGNAAYAAGAMDEAVAAYEQLAASGLRNPEVYCNLGSAYYHQGDLGRAVLNYERALGLRPDFPPAQHNLAIALAATAHQFERPPGFSLDTWRASPVPGVPAPVLRGCLVALWWGLWGILAARQGKAAIRRTTACVLWILLALCAAAMAVRLPHSRSAVVIAPELPMRYGPDARDALRSTLAAGDRVVVDRMEGGWARVETASGIRGWVAQESLAQVGPPFARITTQKE